MSNELDRIIQQSLDNTVAKPPEMNTMHIISWLTKAGINMYPWWSPARDTQLRGFWKQSDHLSGAMYTLCSKMTSIPMRVQARDQSVKEHVRQAEEITFNLNAGAEWGAGWPVFFNKFVEELAGTDNGAFAEVIGAGSPDGPIMGAPVTVRSLDSYYCQRTGDPIYPVIYHDPRGGLYKLHYTRVMFVSQMPSAVADMLGVGFCAISRAVGVAQNLIDVLTYKAEKLGSRPHRGVIVTGGGLDPEDVRLAFESVAHDMDSQGLNRYSKIAVVGSASLPDAAINMTDLAGLPDNFDERTSVELGMATIALAFGMDARELFPSLSSGATRADALIQHLKQRGKGPGQIIQQTELLFNSKYLPPHLEMVFDFQDDEQDRQAAETKELRARRWATAEKALHMDARTVREQMVEVGDLSAGQFEELELADGRLPDGTSVLALFYSEDADMKSLLNLGQPIDPLDIETSNAESVMEAIRKQKAEVNKIIINSSKPDERKVARRALAALETLEKEYNGEAEMERQQKLGTPNIQPDDTTQPDGRTRKVDLTRPKLEGFESDELKPDQDDGEMKEAAKYTGGMIAFYVPGMVAKELALDMEGALPVDELHLTLAYLGDIKGNDIKGYEHVRQAVRNIANTLPPIQATITGVATFGQGEDGKNPIVALVDSPDLPGIRHEIVKELNKVGIKLPREHGFIPHITLAYVDKPIEINVLDTEIEFDNITLAWGNERSIFPLSGNPREILEGKEAGSETASPFEVDFSMILKTIESYRLNIHNAVRGLWSGQVDYLWFYGQMQAAIDHGFQQAWVEGLGMAGILPDEATDMERMMLTRETVNERAYIDGFATYIEHNSKIEGGKLAPLYHRAEMWANGYTRIMNLAYAMASGDKKKKWTLHPAEHCTSCRRLDGKVKRASYWTANGVYPKSWDKLNCHSNCRCSLEDTNEPMSKGPLPKLP